MQRKAFQHRDSPGSMCRRRLERLGQVERLLHGLVLKCFILVVGPAGPLLDPPLLLPLQHSLEYSSHDFVVRRRHPYRLTVSPEQGLRHEQMQVWRQLKTASKPLPKAHRTTSHSAAHPLAARLFALPRPYRTHQQNLESLQALGLSDDGRSQLVRQAQRR
jgi:hypothetical protein